MRRWKTVLMVGVLSVAILIGFYAGVFYASKWMNLEGGLEWAGYTTEADYVIFTDDEGTVYAQNGSTGKIDYNSTSASYVINRAIEALPTTGGYIFIKEGTYIISETIEVSSNVALVGAGFASKFVLAADPNINLIQNAEQADGNDNILIAELHLDGNKAENPAEKGGLFFFNVRNSTIQNCWIHDFGFSGILFYHGGGNVVQNNFVYRNRNAGIEGTHEDHDIVANNVVYSNEGDPYGHGIDYCTGSRYNVFDGNVCYNNGLVSGGGIAIWDGHGNTAIGNILTSNYIGLTVGVPSFGKKTSGNMIIGNTASNNTADGIHIEGENNLVSENAFVSNGGNGVYINGSNTRNTLIDGNRIESNQGWQVHITRFPSDTIIKNNVILGDDLIENEGKNTSIRWNAGYVTENRGTATICVGQTQVSFEHELVSAPTYVELTPKDNLEGRSYWYIANSTHMIIHLHFSDSDSEHSFDWYAET